MKDNNAFFLNKQLNESEIKERKIVLESKPISLMCILTRRCNLECIMCGRVRVRDKPDTLTFELIEKVLVLVPYLELLKWQGGEVFLLDYFKEIFLKISNYPHITQEVTTNGLLIDKEWAKIFSRSRSRTSLLYSVDSVTKTNYEAIRRNAKFEDLLRSLDLVNEIRNLYGGRVKIELHAVVMRRNYKEVELFPDFCNKYNIEILNLNVLWPTVVPEEDIFSGPDKEAMECLNKIIPQIEDKCKQYNIRLNCAFKHCVEDYYRSGGEHKIYPSSLNTNIYIKRDCIFPWNNLHIEPDGYVYPECKCKVSIGYLPKDSFEKIWNSEIMQSYRNFIKTGQTEKICSKQCKFYADLKV